MSQTTASQAMTRRKAGHSSIGLVLVIAAIIGTLAYRSASSAPSFREARPPGAHDAQAPALSGDHTGATPGDDGAVTEEDGALPDSVTVFDDEYPGVANVDADLLQALRAAATAAAKDRVAFDVRSGWRSPEYQDQLLRDAVSTYGSEQEAARWVATSDTSPHVSGDAVDIGSFDAMAWLSEHGVVYGLCQIYRNEPWHFELRPQAVDRGCPRMYADPTRDPRMQQ
jgi:D-alanyl-D-alanine carboxypeptidase